MLALLIIPFIVIVMAVNKENQEINNRRLKNEGKIEIKCPHCKRLLEVSELAENCICEPCQTKFNVQTRRILN